MTERSIKGITCEIISNGIDSRNRALNFSESITLQELEKDSNNKQKYSIESYSDEEYEDLVIGDDTLLKRSFSYVNKVIKSGFFITNNFLKKNKLDLLVHGSDNSNNIDQRKLIIFPRTSNISSTKIRKISYKNIRKLFKK